MLRGVSQLSTFAGEVTILFGFGLVIGRFIKGRYVKRREATKREREKTARIEAAIGTKNGAGTIFEILEKLTETATRNGEMRHALTMPYLEFSVHGEPLTINKAARRAFGMGTEDLARRGWRSIIDERDRPTWDDVVMNQGNYDGPMTLHTDGVASRWNVWVSSTYTAGGKHIGFSLTAERRATPREPGVPA